MALAAAPLLLLLLRLESARVAIERTPVERADAAAAAGRVTVGRRRLRALSPRRATAAPPAAAAAAIVHLAARLIISLLLLVGPAVAGVQLPRLRPRQLGRPATAAAGLGNGA